MNLGLYLFLDDERETEFVGVPSELCLIVRSYEDFTREINRIIEEKIVIDGFFFDHDLGEGKNGFDCMKYMVEKDMDHNFIKDAFVHVHSYNPVGAKNISEYFESYKRTK